jgi:HD-like signal output (HDOD) protein
MSHLISMPFSNAGTFPDDDQLEVVIRSLPAAPRILAELGPHLQLLDFDVAEVTSILRRDSSLTARLIHMANSVAFEGAEPCTSLEEAVARIGYRETYRMLGAVASMQLSNEPLWRYGISARRLRENSLFVALMMEELATAIGIDSRTGYTIGLLRSLGKVVLDRLARENPGITGFEPKRERLTDWEKVTWGCTNTDIAGRILEMWHFPGDAIQAIRGQYRPDSAHPFSVLLHIAASAAEQRGFGLPGELTCWADAAQPASLGISDERFAAACDRAYETLAKLSSVLV